MEEEIKLILESIYSGNNHTGDVYNREAMRELLALFTTKMEEILGTVDNDCPCGKLDCPVRRMNDLLIEQRTRLSKLLEGENT